MAGHVACPIALIITVIEAFLWKQKIIDVLTGGLEGFANGNLANLSGYRGSSVYLQLGRTYKNMELIKKCLLLYQEINEFLC